MTMATKGLYDLSVSICCFWAFAEKTDAVVFHVRMVSVLHVNIHLLLGALVSQ